MMYQQGQHLGLTSAHKFNLVAGVILPAVAVTVEATTHICARMFYDPMPTTWHMLLLLLGPLAQLQVWFAIRRNNPNRLQLAGVANSVAIGIALYYSLIHLPLIPIGALTLLTLAGFLPLSPFFAFLTALLMRRQLRRIAATGPHKSFTVTTGGLLAGLALTIITIGVIELPANLTRYGLQLAASSEPETRTKGIRFLRTYGSRDYLLRRCYEPRGRAVDLVGFLISSHYVVSENAAREIYYRVTGETFDSAPPPRIVNGHAIEQENLGSHENDDAGFTSGILKGLSISSSHLDGKADADGGVANLEWTLAFQNDSDSSKELRAEIQLPPGGVVSSATYWSQGVERTMEFTGRSSTALSGQIPDSRKAGVLVTTAGRDRVSVQCYPLDAFGNTVRIRLGISVPLVLQSTGMARLILPHFNDRNFRIPQNFKHWILIDSTQPLGSDFGLSVHSTPQANGGYQLWGEFTNSEFMRPEGALRLARTDGDYAIWSRNPFEGKDNIVRQSIQQRTPVHLRRIVFVVDTSASLAKWRSQIALALGVLPRDMDVQLVLANADFGPGSNLPLVTTSGRDSAIAYLWEASFAGGADNAPALSKAWDLATDTPGNNAIVWIHAPQRVAFSSIEPMMRRWQHNVYGPSLYSVQTTFGSDAIEKRLDGINEVKSTVRLGFLRTDLESLLQQLTGQAPTFEFVRTVRHSYPGSKVDGVETSDQLARLWANDEVARILGAQDASLRDAASILAQRYNLVTSASGASIYEIPQDIDDGDLAPVTYHRFSSAPVDFASLFLLALVFFIWILCAKFRKANATGCPI